MTGLTISAVEAEIANTIESIKSALKIDVVIDGECCPGSIIKSQILITVMARIGKKLGVIIPNNCYIFHDKKGQKQLTIKEAAQKLIKVAKNGD